LLEAISKNYGKIRLSQIANRHGTPSEKPIVLFVLHYIGLLMVPPMVWGYAYDTHRMSIT